MNKIIFSGIISILSLTMTVLNIRSQLSDQTGKTYISDIVIWGFVFMVSIISFIHLILTTPLRK
jgi:hypothetical protein